VPTVLRVADREYYQLNNSHKICQSWEIAEELSKALAPIHRTQLWYVLCYSSMSSCSSITVSTAFLLYISPHAGSPRRWRDSTTAEREQTDMISSSYRKDVHSLHYNHRLLAPKQRPLLQLLLNDATGQRQMFVQRETEDDSAKTGVIFSALCLSNTFQEWPGITLEQHSPPPDRKGANQ
jgi:hypothetical protein